MRDASFCHLGRVRIEDIILEVVRSLIFCYSDHTERTVLYIFVNGLMTGYTRGTSNRSTLCKDSRYSGLSVVFSRCRII